MKNTYSIEVDLTYQGQVPYYPRNFFIHLHNVPQNAVIHVEYDDKEITPTGINEKGYSKIAFYITPDKAVKVTVSQEETIIGAGTYLIHDGKIFMQLGEGPKIQVNKLSWAVNAT